MEKAMIRNVLLKFCLLVTIFAMDADAMKQLNACSQNRIFNRCSAEYMPALKSFEKELIKLYNEFYLLENYAYDMTCELITDRNKREFYCQKVFVLCRPITMQDAKEQMSEIKQCFQSLIEKKQSGVVLNDEDFQEVEIIMSDLNNIKLAIEPNRMNQIYVLGQLSKTPSNDMPKLAQIMMDNAIMDIHNLLINERDIEKSRTQLISKMESTHSQIIKILEQVAKPTEDKIKQLHHLAYREISDLYSSINTSFESKLKQLRAYDSYLAYCPMEDLLHYIPSLYREINIPFDNIMQAQNAFMELLNIDRNSRFDSLPSLPSQSRNKVEALYITENIAYISLLEKNIENYILSLDQIDLSPDLIDTVYELKMELDACIRRFQILDPHTNGSYFFTSAYAPNYIDIISPIIGTIIKPAQHDISNLCKDYIGIIDNSANFYIDIITNTMSASDRKNDLLLLPKKLVEVLEYIRPDMNFFPCFLYKNMDFSPCFFYDNSKLLNFFNRCHDLFLEFGSKNRMEDFAYLFVGDQDKNDYTMILLNFVNYSNDFILELTAKCQKNTKNILSISYPFELPKYLNNLYCLIEPAEKNCFYKICDIINEEVSEVNSLDNIKLLLKNVPRKSILEKVETVINFFNATQAHKDRRTAIYSTDQLSDCLYLYGDYEFFNRPDKVWELEAFSNIEILETFAIIIQYASEYKNIITDLLSSIMILNAQDQETLLRKLSFLKNTYIYMWYMFSEINFVPQLLSADTTIEQKIRSIDLFMAFLEGNVDCSYLTWRAIVAITFKPYEIHRYNKMLSTIQYIVSMPGDLCNQLCEIFIKLFSNGEDAYLSLDEAKNMIDFVQNNMFFNFFTIAGNQNYFDKTYFQNFSIQ